MSTTSEERRVHISLENRSILVEEFSSLYRTLYVPQYIRNITIVERQTTSADRTVKVD